MPLASSNGYKTSYAAQDCGTGDLTKDCFFIFYFSSLGLLLVVLLPNFFWA